jgi:hypothetical protein
MSRKILGVGILALLAMVTTSSCSSSHKAAAKLSGPQLVNEIVPAPYGYTVDPTAGQNGSVSPAVFATYGGAGSAKALGFVAGFKQGYVDYSTEEGLVVTLLEFDSPSDAAAYLKQTAPKTLSYANATYKPFAQVSGAIEADGTKEYGGEYSRGVVAATKDYYFQMVYVTSAPSQFPTEFYTWAKAQWAVLQQPSK